VAAEDPISRSEINMHTTISVNERNHAEQAAQQSEQRYKRLQASVTDYVYSVTVDQGRPLRTVHGPGCEAVTGYTSQEFDADPFLWYRMICSEDRPAAVAQAEGILRDETPPPLEHRIIHKNGSIRWIRNTPVPHKDALGRLTTYDGLISDITERRRAEQFLAVQHAVTRELGEASSLEEALTRILEKLCRTFQCFPWNVAAFWGVEADANLLRCGQTWHSPSAQAEEFVAASRHFTLALGISLPGQVWASGEPAWIPDMLKGETNCPRVPYARKAGLHNACAFPVRSGKTIVGVIELLSQQIQPSDPDMMQVLMAVGTQVGLFIERKTVEEQRRLSAAQLQAVLDNSPAVIHLKDIQGRYILTNRRFQQLFHLSYEEVTGKSPHELFPQETADALRSHDQQVLARLAPLEFEETLPQDGELHTYISVKLPLLDAAGVPHAICGISTDITEHKRAELALRQSYQTQEVLNALLSISLQDLSLEETLLKVIDQILAIPWLSLETKAAIFVVEADPFALVLKAQRNLPASLQAQCGLVPFGRCLCGRAAASGKVEFAAHIDDHHEIGYEGMTSHGHYCVPIVSAGQVLGVINLYLKANHRQESKEVEFLNAVANVVGSIVQRKRAEEQLKQALVHLTTAHEELKATHEELKATELQLIQAAKLEAVGTLAAGVAHEVKNPLQTMLMGLDYLANNLHGLNDTTTMVLGDMRDAVTRANVIVRELLQISAAKDFEPKAGDLNCVVERSLWLINNEIMASQINVVRKLGTDLPLVRLDRSKMEQVFLNLFLNALQAMSQGGVLTVTTSQRRFGEDLKLGGPAFAQFKPGERVVIAEVQDTGTGIPEDHLPKIFDPFFTTKPTGVGTGLGLSVVKKIMDLHGGGIDVHNSPRGGAVVTLMLKTQPEKTL
jgi:PAS domain S-box-containing protein